MYQLIEVVPGNFFVYSEQILEIEKASFISPWSIEAFRAETQKPMSHLRVVILNEAVAGYICFWVLEGEIQLLNLAVHPERRGKGLGKFLLTGMIEKGISEGVNNICLEVRPSNLSARNLYKKLGFHETGIRSNYYSETKEDAILMSLTFHGDERA
jgi:[ribosomal protein S18]-alanine N-acetyltransferase